MRVRDYPGVCVFTPPAASGVNERVGARLRERAGLRFGHHGRRAASAGAHQEEEPESDRRPVGGREEDGHHQRLSGKPQEQIRGFTFKKRSLYGSSAECPSHHRHQSYVRGLLG